MQRLSDGLLLAALAVTFPASAQTDTQPPRLVGMTISPASVDVTSGPQTVIVTLQITDNLSGVDLSSYNRLGVGLRGPSGVFVGGLPSTVQTGVILAATVTVPIVIPRYSVPGEWQVNSVRIFDNTGNSLVLGNAALVAAGFPSSVAVVDATPDLQAPTLASISLSPNSVDVSAGAVTITADITLADDLSGVRYSYISLTDFELRSPSGRQSRYISGWQFNRISGDGNFGVWRATLKMPRYSEPGIWKVARMRLQDVTANVRDYYPMALAGYGSMVEVAVASSPADLTPPTISSVTVTPNFVNTSLGPQAVQVELTMADDLSGVTFSGDTVDISRFYGAAFASPSGTQVLYTNSTYSGCGLRYDNGCLPPSQLSYWDPAYSDAIPATGTVWNGVWRFSMTVPQFSEEGTWKLRGLQLRDGARNLRVASNPVDIGGLGVGADITVIKPSLLTDGTISDPTVSTVISDTVFGWRAGISAAGGVFTQPTSVAIDVLSSPLDIPLPAGFTSAETYYVSVQFTPTPTFPLPSPGVILWLPMRTYTIPGTAIQLLRIDPATGQLIPALNLWGNPVTGRVDASGIRAEFVNVARFSTLVGVLPDAIAVDVDIKPGEVPNTINTTSNGSIPVAVMSKITLDLTKVDPASIFLSGAPVARSKQGQYQHTVQDVNGDGIQDVVLHFDTKDILLSPGAVNAVLEGMTPDGRRFRGIDSVRISK